MALSKDILGQALYNAREAFNNRTWQDLLDEYGDEAGIRLAAAKADAEAIINHITANGVVVPTALVSPAGPVTGTGTIQ